MPDPNTATLEDRSVSMARANVWTLVILGPLTILTTALFVGMHGWAPLGEAADYSLLVLLALLVLGIVAHEVLHAAAWKVAAGLRWSDVRLGFQVRTLTPYAHARVPMPARAYRIGAAVPGIVLGVVPLLSGLAAGAGTLFLFGLLFTFAAGGDALILWLLRGVLPDALVSDHPRRAGCYVQVGQSEGTA